MQQSMFVNFAYIVDSTNVPLKYFTVVFTPRVVLYQLTNAVFTGLRFEVEQASRGLSAIAELLVNHNFTINVDLFKNSSTVANKIFVPNVIKIFHLKENSKLQSLSISAALLQLHVRSQFLASNSRVLDPRDYKIWKNAAAIRRGYAIMSAN